MSENKIDKPMILAVLVAALGYFVDIYDLLLFSIVRIASLKDMGITGDALLSEGLTLLNSQMLGLLVGGLFWGVWGDKKGRLSVLFGSIFLYSIANILNGFVTTVEQYMVLRFIAGIGLAGELGAGITLVSELLPKSKRGYGTTMVASVGVTGAVVAAFIADIFHWRTCYFIGGGLGLALLVLRVSVRESGMFESICKTEVKRGDVKLLFAKGERIRRYVACILIGVPIWYVIGIIVTLAPEFGFALHLPEPLTAGKAVMFAYSGLAVGDMASGLISQWLKSRKKSVALLLIMTAMGCAIFFSANGASLTMIYATYFFLGIGVGYWAMFVTMAAEQFGTNLRSTVATTVPNFVRGAFVPITMLFEFLKPSYGIISAAAVVGTICLLVAFSALLTLKECFTNDLDFIEE